MLQLTIPSMELWDEVNECFVNIDSQHLVLEHSLISLSKWESIWCKPFLTKDKRSYEETIDYIRCMTINNVDPRVYEYLSQEQIDKISKYIESPMTATTVPEDKTPGMHHETVTSELIYYWMVALQIPFECQKWHLNRLLTLIRVCNFKNKSPKKISRNDALARNKALNDIRRKQLNSKG